MDVSVIICTWNRASRLGVTLESFLECVRPPSLGWELIVVANNCTDDTAAVVAKHADRLPVVSLEEPRQGLSRARNAAIRAARGQLLVFTDDDVRPAPEWIATYWSAYVEKPMGFYFGGPLTSEFETRPLDTALLRFTSREVKGLDFGPHARVPGPGERFAGANWASPADAVRAVGGFDVRLGLDAALGRRRIGENFDLMDRLRARGMSPWYLPRARVVHFAPGYKCSLGYIADNARANGVYAARSGTATPMIEQHPRLTRLCRYGPSRVLSTPLRLYAAAGVAAFRWAIARLQRRNADGERITLEVCRGLAEGYRQRRRMLREPMRGAWPGGLG